MALPTENFDSYSSGDALNGLNGGAGWSGAWSATAAAGEATIDTSQYVSSPNSLQFYRISTECTANRVFSSTATSGTIEIYLRRASVSPDVVSLQWKSGSTAVIRIDFNQAGNVIAYRSGGTTTLQTYTNNTWYKVNVQFDCSTDEYIVTINDGTPSSALAFQNAVSSIDRIAFEISANGAGTPGKNWIDSIGEAAAPSGPTNVKTWDGVTQSTGIKTYNGNTLANTKSVIGVT